MNDREKIKKAIAIIEEASILDRRTDVSEMLYMMSYNTLTELAAGFAEYQNLIYDLRDILEGRNEEHDE